MIDGLLAGLMVLTSHERVSVSLHSSQEHETVKGIGAILGFFPDEHGYGEVFAEKVDTITIEFPDMKEYSLDFYYDLVRTLSNGNYVLKSLKNNQMIINRHVKQHHLYTYDRDPKKMRIF